MRGHACHSAEARMTATAAGLIGSISCVFVDRGLPFHAKRSTKSHHATLRLDSTHDISCASGERALPMLTSFAALLQQGAVSLWLYRDVSFFSERLRRR